MLIIIHSRLFDSRLLKINSDYKKLRLHGYRAACGRANAFFIHKHWIALTKTKQFFPEIASFHEDKVMQISMKILMKHRYAYKKKHQ